jgi:prephenate dehydrogenase
MSTITVGILGLGRVGASVGLALKRYSAGKGTKHDFQIVAYDPRDAAQAAAIKAGVVSSAARNPLDVVRDKDIVVLDLPYADVQTTYRDLGSFLRAGSVLLDVSPLKQPSMVWADKHLAEQAYMVGVTPVVNPAYLFDGLNDTEHARADLFDGGAMLLMPSPKCARDAVELAADLAVILGASAHFMDVGEHDALVASTEGLPALLGLATFYTLKGSPSWGDTQRLTNPDFGRLTHHLADTHPDDLRDLLLNNRQNMLYALDALLISLQQFRAVLDKGDKSGLEGVLVESVGAYQLWLRRREKGRWEDGKDTPRVDSSLLSGMMGGYLSRRLRGSTDDEN